LERALFFYTEVEAEGILVECIYLNDGECRAQPRQHLGEKKNYYKPSEDDKKQYCTAPDFQRCPRFSAYQNHMKAMFPIFGKKGQ
jgi:hypothetical protein